MSILNVALLSKNVGDDNGDNRNNTAIFVKKDGEGREQKHRSHGSSHGTHKQGGHKGRRHHCH